MDISGTSNFAYVTHDDPATGTSMNFYTIDLATGAETLVGAYGAGVFINDIAAVPAPGAAALLGLAGLGAMRRRRN